MPSKKRLPPLKTDRQAKKHLSKDLTPYLSSANFTPVTFEFAPKDKSITLRISADLLECVQHLAKKRRTNYQKLIRQAIEQYIKESS